MRLTSMILAALALSATAAADERSVITVPILMPLDNLQTYANRSLPVELHAASGGKQCVKAKEACTKVLEFRGIKTYWRNKCIQVTPAIDCHLDQRVWREGPLTISGSGDEIILRQAVRARATVRGRGKIGKHIRETANGAAQFTISAQPQILPDWRVALPLNVSFRWTERPNVLLANVFRVTFGGEAERSLNAAFNRFKAQTLPAELARIDLRSRVAPVWSALQEPQRLETGQGPALWLHFRPDAIGMAPPRIADGSINTAASIGGRFRVTDGQTSPFGKGVSAVPDLGKAGPDGVRINLPISIGMPALSEALNANLPSRFEASSPVDATFEIRTARAESVKGRLVLTLDLSAEIAGYSAYSGRVAFSGVPKWSSDTNTLTLSGTMAEAHDGGISAFVLNKILSTAAFRAWISKTTDLRISAEIEKANQALREALNKRLSKNLAISGDIRARISNFSFSGSLCFGLIAEGRVKITLTR